MPAGPDAVERAIQGLERLAGVHVTVMELVDGSLPSIQVERRIHRHRHCQRIKAASPLMCTACDFTSCRQILQRRPEPVWKRCHAGLWELIVPILRGSQLIGICFLGPWSSLPASLQPRWQDPQVAHRIRPPPLPAPADPTALLDLAGMLCRDIGAVPGAMATMTRTALIDDLIGRHLGSELRLASVAAHLGVSESRAGHIVREAYGCSFPHLVEQRRFARACELLGSGEIPIAAVAQRCGFADRRYFARRFRVCLGVTPSAWRRARMAQRS